MTLSLWNIQRSGRMDRAANSDMRHAEVITRRKDTMNDRKCKETCWRGSNGDAIKAVRTLFRFQVGKRWTTSGLRLIAPRRKVLINGWWEMGSGEPKDKTEERAASCQHRVLGANPASRPS